MSTDDNFTEEREARAPGSVPEESARPTRRRGRPPKLVAQQIEGALLDARARRKARVRHDAPPAPIDGDYDPLRLTNEDPEYRYFWSNEKDLARLQYRGWVNETWSPTCARPAYYYGAQNRGEPIRYKDLVLMKLPKVHAEAIERNDPARRRHAMLMSELLHPSKPGHRMEVTQQTLTGGV